jgi:HD-GYP domain-containing protein (c-di-GMP phosphodiesterase class II)
MTTDRPYRKRLPLEDVFNDFRVNTGTQFAPEVVCAFCRAFLKEIEGTSNEKRISRLLAKGYDDVERLKPLLSGLISDLDQTTLTAGAASH